MDVIPIAASVTLYVEKLSGDANESSKRQSKIDPEYATVSLTILEGIGLTVSSCYENLESRW